MNMYLLHTFHVHKHKSQFFWSYSYTDSVVYLLYTTSFVTLEEVKNFKSLQSYKYFTAGWVIDHRLKVLNEVCLIVGKVNHSYAVSLAPLNPWGIIKNNGTVVCGHCTCIEWTHNLSGNLAILLLPRYHYYHVYSNIQCLQHLQSFSLLQPYSHGDIIIYRQVL